MKNKIIFLLVFLFISGCIGYEIDGYFISDNSKNNIKPYYYYYEMKIPSFIDGQNLYFSTVAGSYGKEFVVILFVIPAGFDDRQVVNLENNKANFCLKLNNINKYNRDILKYLSFKIIDNGKEYDSKIKISSEKTYKYWLDGNKLGYQENELIRYCFSVKINQLSKEFKLIVKYKDNEKVLNLKYKKKLYSRAN